MGSYIYKVTGKIVRDDHGRQANLLKYAYKPYYSNDEANDRMERDTGCKRADSYVEKGKTFTGRVAMEPGAESISYGRGTIYDDYFYSYVDRAKEAAKVKSQ